jgi:hypothetical protein
MLEKDTRSFPAAMLLSALLFCGCSGKKEISLSAAEGFYALSSVPEKNPKDCENYFRKYLKNALKARVPEVLEKAYQYTGKSSYSPWELRGILRCALIDLAGKVRTMEEAKTALALLAPALEGMGADKAVSHARLGEAADPGAFTGFLKTLVGELADICLRDVEALKPKDPEAAEKRLTDLRFLLLALPEGESEVVNITRIVWDELNGDVNDVQLDKVRELLRGAYPALVL